MRPLHLCILTLFMAACSSGNPLQTGDTARFGDAHAGAAHPALARETAALRAKQIAHVSYILWFGLDARNNDYQGRAVISFEYRDKARELSPDLLLDFDGGTIHTLTVNGLAVPEATFASRYDGHQLRLKTHGEIKSGANRVELSFTHPYATVGTGFRRFVDRDDEKVYLYTHFGPFDAHSMFPCFDQPDLKAPFELTVDAPDGWEVISNTQERDVTKVDGRRSWAFPPSPVLSTYLFALHAGEYESWKSEHEGLVLRLFARQSLSSKVDSKEWFDVTRKGLDYYVEQFNHPFPYAKYDQVIVPDLASGASQDAGAVLFPETWLEPLRITESWKRERATAILHELAHMWFGDLVTMRWWNGLWINDGFATYAGFRATENATRYKGAWQDLFARKTTAYEQDTSSATHQIDTPVLDTSRAYSYFDAIMYGKGAAAVKQLDFLIDDDDFREGNQRFLNKFAFRNAALADFLKIMSEASGRNLTDWQKGWLHSLGVDTVEAAWSCADDVETGKAKIVTFILKLKPAKTGGAPLSHRARIGLFYQGKGKKLLQATDTIDVTFAQAESPVAEAIGKPCPQMVYPNYQDNDYIRVVLDPKSLEKAKTDLQRIEDPLTRQMIWYGLWEQVLSASVPAQDYFRFALSKLADETDYDVLTSVLSTLASDDANAPTALRYVAPELRGPIQTELETFVRARTLAAPAGSDRQMAWYRAWVQVASDQKSADLLASILAGKKKNKLAALNQDAKNYPERRWTIINTLSRMGWTGAKEIVAEELKTTHADVAPSKQAGAEVRLPDPAIKKRWFDRIIRDSSGPAGHKTGPHMELEDAVEGFQAFGQEEFTREAIGPYFDSLPAIAEHADEDLSERFTLKMYPPQCDASVAGRVAEALKKGPELPPHLVRILKLQQMGTERCIRARQVSARAAAPAATPAAPR